MNSIGTFYKLYFIIKKYDNCIMFVHSFGKLVCIADKAEN